MSEDANSFLSLFLAPVKEFLDDDSVSEILINGPSQVYVERRGRLEPVSVKFVSEPALKAAAVNIARSVERQLDEQHPDLDARLPDGSRVHATIPPISRVGTVVSIRKFKKDALSMADLRSFGSFDEYGEKLMNALVKLRKNIVVSGGTGSGKTTVLNCLSGFIPETERILILEDSSELKLQQPHSVYFETRKPDKHGEGEFAIRDLVVASLRLRPDRIVVGEVRGGEALDLLQAMNTGHAGSMTTIHANAPIDTLSRIETCALMSGIDFPLSAIRAQVASAIDAIVQTARLPDGSRRVISISEVMPLVEGQYSVREIYAWRTEKLAADGSLVGQHVSVEAPTFAADAKIMNLDI